MKFVNLTPHTMNLANQDNKETVTAVPPSGSVARCRTISTPVSTVNGISVVRTTYGAVEGLPAPETDTLYIVSALVRMAVPNRTDVASPGDPARDDQGNVTGCRNLVIN